MSSNAVSSQIANGETNPAPICKEYIKSAELDTGINEVIDSFMNDPAAFPYGALLFQRIPGSRPRIRPARQLSWAQPWPVLSMKSKMSIPGCYVLEKREQSIIDINWPISFEATSVVQASTSPTNDLVLDDFIQTLENGGSLGLQAVIPGTDAYIQGVRQHLGIKVFPISSGNNIFQLLIPNESKRQLGESQISLSTTKSATVIQKAVAELTTVIYHHRGKPRIWIMISPEESTKFENLVRTVFQQEVQDNHCSQFMSHLDIWVTPKLLGAWGVKFFKVIQNERQLLIVMPCTYYWGLSTGFSIIETKAIEGPRWNFTKYRFCTVDNPLCRRIDQSLIFSITTQKLQETMVEAAARAAHNYERRVKERANDDSDSETNSDDDALSRLSLDETPNDMANSPHPRSRHEDDADHDSDMQDSDSDEQSTASDDTTIMPPAPSLHNDEYYADDERLALLYRENRLVHEQNKYLWSRHQHLVDRELATQGQLEQQGAYIKVLERELDKDGPGIVEHVRAAAAAECTLKVREGQLRRRDQRVRKQKREIRELRARLQAGQQ